MKLRKCIALLTATMMTSIVSSSLVFAESYQETEKAKIADFAATVAETIQNAETLYNSETSTYADLCISLDDTGRALLGMMSPVDITWLDNIGFNYSVSYNDTAEGIVGDLYLNNTSVCSLEYYMDLENMCYYIRIPELNDSYLVMDISGNLDEESAAIYDALKKQMQTSVLIPEASAAEDILNRYGTLLADGFVENTSHEDTISIEGVSMDCLSLEGQMQLEDIQNLLTNVLTTAKDDAQLKELIEAWAPLFQAEDDTLDVYQEFQTFILDMLISMNEQPLENDGTSLSSTIWQDTDGNIVGRQLSINNGAEEIPFLTYKAPVSGSEKAFYLKISDGDESFSISGKGTITNEKLNGSYDLMYDDVIMASVELIDTDTATAEDGSSFGSYKFTLQPGIGEETYQYLSSFALVADVSNYGEAADEELQLALTMSDASLLSMSLNAGLADAIEIPDYTAFANVLDVNSEDDMITYVSEMDWAPILKNCIAAGMTEEVAAALDDMIYEALYGAMDDAE